MGITEATVFARRNDATLLTYRNDAARDRVRVEVRLDRQVGGADDVSSGDSVAQLVDRARA